VADISYYQQIEGGIFGQPDGPDPSATAALQEKVAQQQIAMTQNPGYVPPGYNAGPPAPLWAAQTGGPSSLPIIGWTAQKDYGTSPFRPYDTSHIGRIPDWTSDANSSAAGRFDQNQAVGSFAFDPAGRAAVGEGLLQFDDTPVNPNRPPNDISGSIELEY
jgi:hypothetical protein